MQCISCEEELTFNYQFGDDHHNQWDDAIRITVDGYWGGFYDSDGAPHEVYLCKKCILETFQTAPWLKKAVMQHMTKYDLHLDITDPDFIAWFDEAFCEPEDNDMGT